MRRPTTVEVMLLTVVVLWALNLTVSRYIITHGMQPLAYSTVRYAAGALIFAGLVLAAERSLRVGRHDLAVIAVAGIALWLNQLGFVYGLKEASASVIGLVFGGTPIFAALIGLAFGIESLPRRFWLGAALSFVGVGLVAVGTGTELSGNVVGVLWGLLASITWAAYSTIIAPLMRRHSASKISALVLPVSWIGIVIVGLPQIESQDWGLGWQVWSLVVFATLGPLVVTNVLFFRSLDRIGAPRATLATNLQPFVAAIFAVILLGERMNAVQWLGGLLILVGIVAARRRIPVSPVE